jgi:hypothetical protein
MAGAPLTPPPAPEQAAIAAPERIRRVVPENQQSDAARLRLATLFYVAIMAISVWRLWE